MLLWIGQPALVFAQAVFLRHPQRDGQAPSRPHHSGNKLQLPRSGLTEKHRLVRRLDDGTEIGKRHRLVVHLHLAELRQLLHETPQAETVEITVVWVHVYSSSFSSPPVLRFPRARRAAR